MKGKLVPIDFSKIPVVNLCPKCGGEMTAEHYPEHNESHYECRCGYQLVHLGGHEEKLKDGEG